MHWVRVLSSSPAIGLAWCCLVSVAPVAQAVVPCTLPTVQGPVTVPVSTLKSCAERLQQSTAEPDSLGRVYGQYGPIQLAASASQTLRFYEDSQTWSVLHGYGGRRFTVTASSAPSPPPVRQPDERTHAVQALRVVKPVAVAAAVPAPRLSFAEALEAALDEAQSQPVSPVVTPVRQADPTQRLLQALVKLGFRRQAQGEVTCGVRVERQWFGQVSPSLPHCAAQLAEVGRMAPRLRMVTAEWNGHELWLGADAVYRKGPKGAWSVAAAF